MLPSFLKPATFCVILAIVAGCGVPGEKSGGKTSSNGNKNDKPPTEGKSSQPPLGGPSVKSSNRKPRPRKSGPAGAIEGTWQVSREESSPALRSPYNTYVFSNGGLQMRTPQGGSVSGNYTVNTNGPSTTLTMRMRSRSGREDVGTQPLQIEGDTLKIGNGKTMIVLKRVH